MSWIISDVLMTFKSFSDVLTFLSDKYRIDSKINPGVYIKNKYSIVLMVNWSAVVRTYQESARLSVGTAWHMKMWAQLWFENINDKELCYTLYRCTPDEADRAFNSNVLYAENILSCSTLDILS